MLPRRLCVTSPFSLGRMRSNWRTLAAIGRRLPCSPGPIRAPRAPLDMPFSGGFCSASPNRAKLTTFRWNFAKPPEKRVLGTDDAGGPGTDSAGEVARHALEEEVGVEVVEDRGLQDEALARGQKQWRLFVGDRGGGRRVESVFPLLPEGAPGERCRPGRPRPAGRRCRQRGRAVADPSPPHPTVARESPGSPPRPACPSSAHRPARPAAAWGTIRRASRCPRPRRASGDAPARPEARPHEGGLIALTRLSGVSFALRDGCRQPRSRPARSWSVVVTF